jgi:hypothetical protein
MAEALAVLRDYEVGSVLGEDWLCRARIRAIGDALDEYIAEGERDQARRRPDYRMRKAEDAIEAIMEMIASLFDEVPDLKRTLRRRAA